MDLSWNYAAESQAYDRVHRLGQEKDVFVKRLVVENTIEERMLRLQDVKMGTVFFYPHFCFIDFFTDGDSCVFRACRTGRCGSGRRDGSQAAQAECPGDQSGTLSLYSLHHARLVLSKRALSFYF